MIHHVHRFSRSGFQKAYQQLLPSASWYLGSQLKDSEPGGLNHLKTLLLICLMMNTDYRIKLQLVLLPRISLSFHITRVFSPHGDWVPKASILGKPRVCHILGSTVVTLLLCSVHQAVNNMLVQEGNKFTDGSKTLGEHLVLEILMWPFFFWKI